MPNTKKGGYKPSKFTKFMKSVNVNDLIEINFLRVNNAKQGNFTNTNTNNYLLVHKVPEKNKLCQKNRIKDILLDKNKVSTEVKKLKLKYLGKHKSGNEDCNSEDNKLMNDVGFSKKRNCYKFQKINNNQEKINNNQEKIINIITFTKGKVRRGYFVVTNELFYFDTDKEDNFEKVVKKTNTKNTKKTNTKKTNTQKKVTIYWIRHAWSCGNLLQYYGKLKRLKMPKLTPDANLSGLGILQSQLLGYNEELRDIFNKADRICSSELKRAMQTALYAKMYSGNSEKTLNIIPQTNETLYGKNMPEAFRTLVSRSATPISYYSREDYNKIIKEFRRDYNQKISMDFYNKYYETNDSSTHRKQQLKIINSSHKNFRRNVLPELLNSGKFKNPNNPVLVIFGHGKYIAGILKEVCGKDCTNENLIKLKKEGIYNTGIYKVNYEYSDDEYRVVFQTAITQKSIERIFPLNNIGEGISLNSILENSLSQLGGEYNEYGNTINNQNNNSRGKYLLRTNNRNKNLNNNRNKRNNNRINNNGTTLTEYRNKLANYMKKNKKIPYTLIKDKNSDLMFYSPSLPFIEGLPKIPIILTGQKTGEDKKVIQKFWLDNADLFIGDSVGYTANKARYTNKNIQKKRLTKQSKYDHGCLIDLKKYLLKDKSRNFNITNLNENTQARIEIIFNLYFYIQSKIEKNKIQSIKLPNININALETENGRKKINGDLRRIIQNLNKKK